MLDLLNEAADVVVAALEPYASWDARGTRPGQYGVDVVADEAVVPVLERAGVGVLSEESGLQYADREVLVVVDPVDGSTNASRRIPWYATSLCAVDAEGPAAAVVVNLANGVRYEAVRGGGSWRDGEPIVPSGCRALGEAVVGLSGMPPRRLGWRQFRALGAAALDMCAVADGTLDAYLDCSADAHGPWDYLGALLVCREAGAAVVDAAGRDLVARGHADRRTPVAAATPELLDALLAEYSVDDRRRPVIR
ncbi:MAG TPA: inositol monophosphatase family protein [Acidimicrobiales bacterium]|nr:inositol monophosphatase family protein [Acidimicrobiales bacterium]